jgi:hypothetical protein
MSERFFLREQYQFDYTTIEIDSHFTQLDFVVRIRKDRIHFTIWIMRLSEK